MAKEDDKKSDPFALPLSKELKDRPLLELDPRTSSFGARDIEASIVKDFSLSTVYAPVEILGIQPPKKVREFRDKYPVAGFTSQLTGYALPYAGWIKAANKIKPLRQAMDKVASAKILAERPFAAGFAREVVRFAPFEGLRVATAATTGDIIEKGINEFFPQHGGDAKFTGTAAVAKQALMDLTLGGIFGGAFERVFHGAGPKRSVQDVQAEAGVAGDTFSDQFRQQFQNIEREKYNLETKRMEKAGLDISGRDSSAIGGVRDLDAAQIQLEELRSAVRAEFPFDRRYVDRLSEDEINLKGLNRLFRMKPGGAHVVGRTPTVGDRGFPTQAALDDVLARAEFPPGWEGYVRFPRFLSTKNPQGVEILNRLGPNNLTPLDSKNGIWWAKQANEDSFVMLKRLKKLKDSDPDEYVLFKTNSPKLFAPEHAKYSKGMVEAMARISPELKKLEELGVLGTDTYDGIARIMRALDFEFAGVDPRRSTVTKITEAVIRGLGLEGKLGSEATRQVGIFARRMLVPGQFRYSRDREAAQIFNLARASVQAADATSRRLFFGPKGQFTKDDAGGIFAELMRNRVDEGIAGSLKSKLDKLFEDPSQVKAVWQVWRNQASIEEGIKEYGLKGVGLDYLRHQAKVDEIVMNGVRAVNKATADPEKIKALRNHFGLSRLWKGNLRLPIYEGDRLVHVLGGSNGKTMARDAADIVAIGKKAGLNLRAAEIQVRGDFAHDISLADQIDLRSNKRFNSVIKNNDLGGVAPIRAREIRRGIGGFIGDKEPWTKQELQAIALAQIRDYQTYIAERAFLKGAKNLVDRVGQRDTALGKTLKNDIDAAFGRQGGFSKEINNAIDASVGKIFGTKNTASALAGTLNKAMFNISLGFAHTSFNLANLLTFVQTALPEMAFIRGAAPEKVSRYYMHFPLAGAKTGGKMSVLDMWKVARDSFGLMARPDKTLRRMVQKAENEGHLGAKFIEEHFGQQSVKLRELGGVIKGDVPLTEYVNAMATFIPSKTERFARGHGFILGYTFWKNVMGVTDPDLLYRLSVEFLEKTQFLYNKGDRAALFRGPIGSSFGMFKNWVSNYIGMMGNYTGEAFVRGNWRPLLWMMGSTAGIGGLGSLPFIGTADATQKLFTNESLMQHTYDAFGKGKVADGLWHGIPAFFGFTLRNQVQAPLSDPVHDASWLMSAIHLKQLGEVTKAVGTAIDAWNTTGVSPVQDQATRDAFIRAFLPRTFYRAAQGMKEQLNGLQSGDPTIDVSTPERLMFMIGLDPVRVSNIYAASRELWNAKDKRKEYVRAASRRMADAILSGNGDKMKRLIEKMVNQGLYNEMQSVMQGVDVHIRNSMGDVLTRGNNVLDALSKRKVIE